MKIKEHLDKKNLHHAYLIEGDRGKIVPEILEFCEDLGLKTSGNPDFCHIVVDNFKIDEALNLRSMGSEKSFSLNKKIFLVCSNSFTLDAQGTLLKMFEEPKENVHFFLVTPDANSLLKTLVSRFYFISTRKDLASDLENAEKFIKMSLPKRIDFLKELLPPKKEENDEEASEVSTESNSSKALKFLNSLESVLHQQLMSKPAFDMGCFEHFFKVREFLRMPGSSAKTLMESVAMITPVL
ncbi:hypothetical protein A2917_00910 [Candidatus Nomurabacteria bacterium RIFCSPLOWO2_01_FULL_42_17]|uniref:Uncharacterized protein n=1 Tax=Candidatus Nomurabacteria bacterium RIFCSPLOWO2_01_FULL_42_17 TaxID=1801780 RepID=A0A1F6XMG9_9BACT|nr:MAG: hypothetical protein A2917_00910 [Candidatus Nomurabacteria bacterium RIFCSPLOWO2_01_FULL_42_17]